MHANASYLHCWMAVIVPINQSTRGNVSCAHGECITHAADAKQRGSNANRHSEARSIGRREAAPLVRTLRTGGGTLPFLSFAVTQFSDPTDKSPWQLESAAVQDGAVHLRFWRFFVNVPLPLQSWCGPRITLWSNCRGSTAILKSKVLPMQRSSMEPSI